MATHYDIVFTDIGLLRCSGPWIIKEILSFWFQMESVPGLPAAHWGFPCIQQASCSPLWPPSAESQLSFFGSEVSTPQCLLLVTCFINLHLCLICQFDLTSEPCPRDCTSLSLWAWPSLQKLYFSGPDEAGLQTKCFYLSSHYFLSICVIWSLFSRARPWMVTAD